MKEIKVRYHRHAYEIRNFIEHINAVTRGEQEKFLYCDICKCVPTDMVGKEEYVE